MAASRHADSAQVALERIFAAVRRNIPWIEGATVMTAQGRPIAHVGTVPVVGEDATATDQAPGTALGVTDTGRGADVLPHFRILLPPASDRNVTVCASVNAARFSAVLDGARIGRTGEVFLIDQAGTLRTASVMHGAVMSSVDEALLRSPLTTTVYLCVHGRDRAFGPERTGPCGAGLAARGSSATEGEILQSHDGVMLRSMGLGLLGFAALGALGFTTLRRTRRLQEFMDAEHARISEHTMHVRKLDAISQLGVGHRPRGQQPPGHHRRGGGWMQDVLRRESFRDNPDAGELQDSLRQIVSQTARSREITHKLLSFGGKTNGTIRDTDVNTLIGDVIMLRQREASTKQIEIREEPAGNLPVILSEPSHLRQLLANLITQQHGCMPHGGVINRLDDRVRRRGVNVSVRDTGFGIPRENLPRIFDPFSPPRPGEGGRPGAFHLSRHRAKIGRQDFR